MSESSTPATAFGPNAWLVDDMYERYVADPDSVGESWKEFFADYKPELRTGQVPAIDPPAPPPAPAPPKPAAPAPAPAPTATAASATPKAESGDAEPLRGAAARIVLNMEAS